MDRKNFETAVERIRNGALKNPLIAIGRSGKFLVAVLDGVSLRQEAVVVVATANPADTDLAIYRASKRGVNKSASWLLTLDDNPSVALKDKNQAILSEAMAANRKNRHPGDIYLHKQSADYHPNPLVDTFLGNQIVPFV